MNNPEHPTSGTGQTNPASPAAGSGRPLSHTREYMRAYQKRKQAERKAHPEKYSCECTKPAVVFKHNEPVCARCHALESIQAANELRAGLLRHEGNVTDDAPEWLLRHLAAVVIDDLFTPRPVEFGEKTVTVFGHGTYVLSVDFGTPQI